MTSLIQYEIRDLLGAVDFARARPELNRPIVLYGFSMGAATALVAGAQEPAVAGVIADSPFADLDGYLCVRTYLCGAICLLYRLTRLFCLSRRFITGLDTAQVSPLGDHTSTTGLYS